MAQETSFADDVKGFFSSLFGNSPAPAKKTPAVQPATPKLSHAHTSSPYIGKHQKGLEDDWMIVKHDQNNIPSDLKKRQREGAWNYKDYIMSEDYLQELPAGPTNQDKLENWNRFQNIFSETDRINLTNLRRCMWDTGCHKDVRAITWKLISGYLPDWSFLHEPVLRTRRSCYLSAIRGTYRKLDIDEEATASRQLIRSGLSNTALKIPLFRSSKLSKMLERVIFMWLLDNPTQPYTDTLALIPLPITYVFLKEYGNVEQMDIDRDVTDENILNLEVDVYNTMSLLLKGDLRLFIAGGQNIFIERLSSMISTIDPVLANYLNANIQYASFALVWFDTLLIGSFQKMPLVAFLWDRCIASGKFLDYFAAICCFLLARYSSNLRQLKEKDLQDFLIKLPLSKFDYSHVEQLVENISDSFSKQFDLAPPLDYVALKNRALARSALELPYQTKPLGVTLSSTAPPLVESSSSDSIPKSMRSPSRIDAPLPVKSPSYSSM